MLPADLLFISRLRDIEHTLVKPEILDSIAYIKKNSGTTADKVVKYLEDRGTCSRLTTLKAIKKLKEFDIIRDNRKGRYFHRLYFNKDFQFKSVAYDSLIEYLNSLRKLYDKYAVDNRHNELFRRIESIVKEYKDQMESMYELEKRLRELIKSAEKEWAQVPDI